MRTIFFGVDQDDALVWFWGEDVRELRQVNTNTHLFDLEHVNGNIYYLKDCTVVQGEIQKVLDAYDRVEQIQRDLIKRTSCSFCGTPINSTWNGDCPNRSSHS